MLKIRLQRTGRKHEPTFRVVLTDSKNSTKSGKFLEILGSYDPRDRNETVLKAERIQYWIGQGAKPTDTLHNLLINKGVIKGEKINVLPKKSPVVDEEALKAAKEAEEKAQAEAEATAEDTAEEVVAETPSEEQPVETKPEVKEESVIEEVKEEPAPSDSSAEAEAKEEEKTED
ncbi:30S ribosomal protein S16 [Candidatus Nomurabacteria bacterium]|nr:30S ribosomal protein S16 [Candidatus Nomurabacteria bacterium]